MISALRRCTPYLRRGSTVLMANESKGIPKRPFRKLFFRTSFRDSLFRTSSIENSGIWRLICMLRNILFRSHWRDIHPWRRTTSACFSVPELHVEVSYNWAHVETSVLRLNFTFGFRRDATVHPTYYVLRHLVLFEFPRNNQRIAYFPTYNNAPDDWNLGEHHQICLYRPTSNGSKKCIIWFNSTPKYCCNYRLAHTVNFCYRLLAGHYYWTAITLN